MWICVFDERGNREVARHAMARGKDNIWRVSIPGLSAGARYGFRADGDYDPERGLWFDPDKLLVDPYAIEIDRPYVYDPRLAAKRGEGGDTAPLMPKAVAAALPDPVSAPPRLFAGRPDLRGARPRPSPCCIPDVPEDMRGTIAALAASGGHRTSAKADVSAVELMPVTAWIDERHLPPLGLTNAWGYNPVTFMALDPAPCAGRHRPSCAIRSRPCGRQASASSSTWCSTIPAKAMSSARRFRCAGSTT